MALQVSGHESLLLGRAELVVDGEVAEVEPAVAHPRVLPVDEPDPVGRVDEVGGEEVVVAEDDGLVARSAGADSIRAAAAWARS